MVELSNSGLRLALWRVTFPMIPATSAASDADRSNSRCAQLVTKVLRFDGFHLEASQPRVRKNSECISYGLRSPTFKIHKLVASRATAVDS